MIGNCLAVGILALFVAAGLAAARRALPQENMEVVLPLGCGFGVSLLAALPALCALVLKTGIWPIALAMQTESMAKIPLCIYRVRSRKWIHDVTVSRGEEL